jgi:hypothetical protein
MRLYKQKDIPKPPRSALDCPPGLPSTSPGSTTPDRFKRAAEAVSKQISGHKAMVAQFKEMRFPRPPMFSTKPATPTKPDHSHPLPPTQSKATKRSGKPQTVPARSSSNPKTPTSASSLKQRPVLSNVDTNLPSLTRPPGLGSEKTTPPVNKPSARRTAPKTPQSVQSPTHSSLQQVGTKSSTSLSNNRTSTGADLASISVASAPTQIDVDEPILFVSCFHSLEEEDSEIEDEDELLQTVEATSDLESQVARIFGVGLGCVSEDEAVKHGVIAPPKVTPEAMLAPTLEPMSAVVEWWEPTVNPAIESDVAMAVKSKGETDGFETVPLAPDQNNIACVPSTNIGSSSPSLAYQPSQPTSLVRFDMELPGTDPCQPPSSADFEFVASLCSDAFRSIVLCVHKQSRRQCAVKIIPNAVLEDQRFVRAVLAEQRIMREVSRYPFLLGLLASFRGVRGLYLVSVSLLFASTRRHKMNSHCPISGILLFHSIRWALSYARVVQEARICRIGEPSLTRQEKSYAYVGCPGVRGRPPPRPWDHSSRHQIGECDGEG